MIKNTYGCTHLLHSVIHRRSNGPSHLEQRPFDVRWTRCMLLINRKLIDLFNKWIGRTQRVEFTRKMHPQISNCLIRGDVILKRGILEFGVWIDSTSRMISGKECLTWLEGNCYSFRSLCRHSVAESFEVVLRWGGFLNDDRWVYGNFAKVWLPLRLKWWMCFCCR